MNLFFKIFLISFLVFIAGFSLVQAGTSDLFSGYAWSENIGWISFNSTDCDVDSNGYIDTGVCGGDNTTIIAQPLHGVTFSESSGVFNGHAWSENIGWITFKESELVGCPSGICQAHISTSTNEVSGWGRALAHGDGWEGWLSLRGTNPDYGVTRSVSGDTAQQLVGYAWGGSVVGWIDFNCSNATTCGAVDYHVDIYGADIIDPNSYIYSPASGSWYLDDFTIYVTDEDPGGSGINNNECKYKIFNYDGGAEQSVSNWHSRTCNSSVGITANADSSPDGCWFEGEDSCNIYVRSKDMAGNEYVNTETSYSIDFTAPIPGELYDSDNPEAEEPIEVTEGVIYTLKSGITDNLKVTACALFINGIYQPNTVTLGSGTTNRTASVEYQFTSSGTYHNNYMKCRDAAGNISTGEPMTFFTVLKATSPVITSLTAYSSHCDTPSTECTSQYSCCMNYTTQTNCCVKFNVSAYDPDDLPLNYSWTFGDGGNSTDEDPHHHYSTTASPHTVTVTVSNGTEQSQQNTEVVVTNPTLSVDLSAIPSFGSVPLNNVDLRDIVAGTMFGTVDYKFDCVENSGWDLEVSNQSSIDYTAVDVCNYAATTTYTAKTTVWRGTGNISDTIDITAAGSCVYNADPGLNATTTCISDQGCSTTTYCHSDNTWLSCPSHDCTVGDTQSCGTGGEQTCSASCTWGTCIGEGDCTSDFDCYCPLDSCSAGDYYNYPIYGSCIDYFCDVGVAIGSPCEASVTIDDPSCNTPPICNSLTPVPSSGVGPLDVTLTASAVDDDGTITHYEFSFGDGTYTTVTGDNVSHIYAEPATASTTYTAEVKARDNDYDWSTVTAQTDIIVTKNIPPVASLGCGTSTCGIGFSCNISGTSIVYNQNCQFVFTNESTDDDSSNPPDNNDHIVQSVWSIFYDGGTAWYDPYDTYSGASTMDSLTLPTGMPQSQAYYLLLEVEDAKGATATTSADFYMRREIVSSFQCSLDPGEEKVWKSCNNLSVSEDETVYLKDLSVGSEPAQAGGEATITSWAWTFTGGTPPTSSQQEPTVSFVQGVANTGRIELVVTDNASRTDTTTRDLIITIPLPEWQEIPPI